METKISIPKPCHEDWNSMLPDEQGRHCLSCCKTVIDFSGWKPGDISAYLQSGRNNRVCGRFSVEQVDDHTRVMNQVALARLALSSPMPLLRKIAAVIVICFGLLTPDSSYAQRLTGEPAAPTPTQQVRPTTHINGNVPRPADTAKHVRPPQQDTLPPMIMGRIALPPAKDRKPSQKAAGQSQQRATKR